MGLRYWQVLHVSPEPGTGNGSKAVTWVGQAKESRPGLSQPMCLTLSLPLGEYCKGSQVHRGWEFRSCTSTENMCYGIKTHTFRLAHSGHAMVQKRACPLRSSWLCLISVQLFLQCHVYGDAFIHGWILFMAIKRIDLDLMQVSLTKPRGNNF